MDIKVKKTVLIITLSDCSTYAFVFREPKQFRSIKLCKMHKGMPGLGAVEAQRDVSFPERRLCV